MALFSKKKKEKRAVNPIALQGLSGFIEKTKSILDTTQYLYSGSFLPLLL